MYHDIIMIAVLAGSKEEFQTWLRRKVYLKKIHETEIGNYRCICNRADHIGIVFSEIKTIGTWQINPVFDTNFLEEIQLRTMELQLA